jgi:hypothetical protein
VRGDLKTIARQSDARVGAKIGRGLRGLHFIHTQGVGLESGVGGLKSGLYLIPGKAWLRHKQGWDQNK